VPSPVLTVCVFMHTHCRANCAQVVAFFQEQGLSLAESNALYRELYTQPVRGGQQQPQQQPQQQGSGPRPMPHTLEVRLWL